MMHGNFAEQFSAWETRGRGWQIWPRPVVLEPAFIPFLGYRSAPAHTIDDARRPTWLSRLTGSLLGTPSTAPTAPEPDVDEESGPDPELEGFGRSIYRVLLPPGLNLPPSASEQLVGALSAMGFPVSFELVADSAEIRLQLTCDAWDAPHVVEQFGAHAPAAALIPAPDHLVECWRPDAPSWIIELGLSREFLRPLQRLSKSGSEPLTQLIATLGALGEGEVALVQVLFQNAGYPWAESALHALMGGDGRPLPIHSRELVSAATDKLSAPLHAAVVRLGVQSGSREEALSLLSRLMMALSPLAVPLGNELIPLSNDGYPDDAHLADLFSRSTRRSGMLLSRPELAALVHLPAASIEHARFRRLTKRTAAAPAAVLGHELILGQNTHLGRTQVVTLSAEQRMRHLHVLGASGTGKSTLLLSMITQDIEAGRGVAVLDPHGDLVDDVLGRIPEERLGDVVLIDPADEEYPVGFNVLAAHSELERMLLSSDLVGVFRRLSSSWGDQMNSVFGNATLAFLESSQGGTLLDLRRFLVDGKFRAAFLETVADAEVVFYWQREYPLLRGNAQAPILTRLDAFLRPKLIRNMVSQRENRINLRSVMDSGKILLVKLAHGAIGEENSYLLGALLVAKINQVALSRQDQERSARRDFFVYVDEFHNFATPSLGQLLSGVRKYRLGLTLAHQELQQLGSRSDGLLSSILGNSGTRIVFRVGEGDARALAEGFSHFEREDLTTLGIGEAIGRVERADFDFNLRTAPLPPIAADDARRRRQGARELSRSRYATRREEVAAAAAPIKADPPEPALPKTREPAPSPRPVVRAERPRLDPVSAGRGGAKHKYLQTLIKKLGEERGFRASIEHPVLDGAGSVDVALESEKLKVAVEITVTTPTAHEIGNIQKCLAAGFDQVLLVATDAKNVNRLVAAVERELAPEQLQRVLCLPAEAVPEVLARLTVPEQTSETVAGYKVSVRYGSGGKAAPADNLRAVRDVIARSLRRPGTS